MKQKILIIVGTRPEAVKLCPLIVELSKQSTFEYELCSTGQHKEILNDTFMAFGIQPTYHLDILKPNATLAELTSNCLVEMDKLLSKAKPSVVLVQGDTTTAFAAGLAAFYHKIPVGHIEAGLRTHNRYLPFPEEINRTLLSSITSFHFAPTELSKENLEKEGFIDNVWVTGNTVIDAVNLTLTKLQNSYSEDAIIKQLNTLGIQLDFKAPFILATCHRRENMTHDILNNIGQAFKKIAQNTPIILTKHPNPNMQPLYTLLEQEKNIILVNPPSHPIFLWLLSKASLVITDSGGVQEESSSFQKQVLILRDSTERPEIVHCGLGELVGHDTDLIINRASTLLTNPIKTIKNPYPFGDGKASERIITILTKNLRSS